MIVFELFPGVTDSIKKQSFHVEFVGETLVDALGELIQANPHLAKYLQDDEGQMLTSLATFVNDEQILQEAKSTLSINDGDRITILPAISGG